MLRRVILVLMAPRSRRLLLFRGVRVRCLLLILRREGGGGGMVLICKESTMMGFMPPK